MAEHEQDPRTSPLILKDSTGTAQHLGYLRVYRVEVIPDQGAGDLVEVRAGTDGDALFRSLFWHCRQDDAPKAGEVLQVLIVKPDYSVMEAKQEPEQ